MLLFAAAWLLIGVCITFWQWYSSSMIYETTGWPLIHLFLYVMFWPVTILFIMAWTINQIKIPARKK